EGWGRITNDNGMTTNVWATITPSGAWVDGGINWVGSVSGSIGVSGWVGFTTSPPTLNLTIKADLSLGNKMTLKGGGTITNDAVGNWNVNATVTIAEMNASIQVHGWIRYANQKLSYDLTIDSGELVMSSSTKISGSLRIAGSIPGTTTINGTFWLGNTN